MDFNSIQKKWQDKWEDDKVFRVSKSKKKKFYCLEMFPYPSGSGLHIGHAFNYTIGDIFSRYKRMNGFNVLYPMGYDSFGLPAENAAIKAKTHPREYTKNAILNFINQQKKLGISYDWDRMISTSDPVYYKWNQYFFLELLKKGLVYRKNAPVNWCLECNTVLANEQVHDGKCWRHEDTDVEQKNLEQWFIKTTDYADELLEEIPTLKWPERIKLMQENWIGKSTGLQLKFDVVDSKGKKIDEIETFTTRADTVYGITYLVLAPEHPKVMEWVKGEDNEHVVKEFVVAVKKQTTIERTAEGKEKKGVFLGKYFLNPFTGDTCPIWTADYALHGYGTGAVMAVPCHDQRDFEFAKKYNLPMKIVVQSKERNLNIDFMKEAFVEEGILINSESFDNLDNKKAISEISKFAEKKKGGVKTTQYRLKDWLVSRQRYWGTPIPIIYCDKCGAVPVPEKDLPVELPKDVKFGEGNPLLSNKEFVNVKCPKCSGKAKRETDTMDTFFDSSWYFLRFCDPKNSTKAFGTEADYWMPVDQYIGGAEHACMHLIYARFFTKVLRDMGLVKVDEPFISLFNQGMIHGEDGFKMSKSRGNVIEPLDMIAEYGADSVRFYLVSVAGPDKDIEWNKAGVEGSSRFVRKVCDYLSSVKIGKSSKKVESKLNKTIQKVAEDIEHFKYNSAIIALRELLEGLEKEVSKDTLEKFLQILHPFCPHLTEEFWEKFGGKGYISLSKWPTFNESKIDLEAEAIEEIISNTSADIHKLLELIKIKPKKVTLIVSPAWKYILFTKLKSVLETTYDVGEVLKYCIGDELKEHGQDISRLVPTLMKDRSRIPHIIVSQDKEVVALESAIEAIGNTFSSSVEVVTAEESKDKKKGHALPGKPAIVVE